MVYMCDFETTVTGEGKQQESTEVWAVGMVGIQWDIIEKRYIVCENSAMIFNTINKWWDYVCSLSEPPTIYFHNLKFDGSFILDYLLRQGYKNALNKNDEWIDVKNMVPGSMQYVISSLGAWYKITVNPFKSRFNSKNRNSRRGRINILDSLKLLPFSVKSIGQAFNTKHQKLSIEYVGDRHAGGVITDDEKAYICNDVYVVAEALAIMFNDNLQALTIGSCCKAQYKDTLHDFDYSEWFPNLTEFSLDTNIYGVDNADAYIRKSYRGGWCYVVEGKENKVFNNGVTADVNSLYPSVMHSESKCKYPIGKPKFWSGNYIPDKATKKGRCFFVRIRTEFFLKDGYLPFISIKDSSFYDSNKCLKSSYIEHNGKVYTYNIGENGEHTPLTVNLTLTEPDYYLFLEHYNVDNFEILDGCYFISMVGLFDEYINKWSEVKQREKGAKRTQAKLFLNNLYGKFSSKPDASFKVAYIDERDKVNFRTVFARDNEKAWYIPVGSYVTSHARNFTIRTAQANYHGVNKRGFIYADTDSIHCDLAPEELVNVKVHPTHFNCWKLESSWDEAIFLRAKTYIEHNIAEDLEAVEPYYNIKCAGMDSRPKQLLQLAFKVSEMGLESDGVQESLSKADLKGHERQFVEKGFTLPDFKTGLEVPGKLIAHRVKGGIVLCDTSFILHEEKNI